MMLQVLAARRDAHLRTLFLMFLTVVAAACAAAQQERRLALVLANEDYPAEIGRLTNTHEDAATVEAALRDTGFAVTKVLDADAEGLEIAITNFEIAIDQEAADGDKVVAFVYASMHGAAVDVDGRSRNFLLPAREQFASAGQVIRKGLRMDQLISGLSSTNADAILVVSDACRNELGTSFTKSTTKGFVPIGARPGVLVAYATAPGATTPDDGLFAQLLARELREPGRKASFTILEAIEQVARRRSLDAQPFLASGGLPDWLCFNGCGVDDDERDWERLSPLGMYDVYLELHPSGRFAAEARRLIGPSSSEILVSTAENIPEEAQETFDRGAEAWEQGRLTAAWNEWFAACQIGVLEACLNLALMSANGEGTEKNEAAARVFYMATCEGGLAQGCTGLAVLLERGIDLDEDVASARGFYRRGCDGGDANACAFLGKLFEEGRGGIRNISEACKLYREACDAEIGVACHNLGMLISSGANNVGQQEEARTAYRKACDAGYRDGCFNLANMLLRLGGDPRNETEARKLYQRTCDEGDPDGCGMVGNMMFMGQGGKMNKAEGTERMRSACRNGSEFVCTWLEENRLTR